MEFVLKGFRQDKNTRHYSFDGIAGDRKHTEFEVDVDLTLAHKYSIPMQELPLLCRELLVAREDREQVRLVTFSETEMLGYANRRAVAAQAAAEKKQRSHRRPVSSRIGQAWRGPRQ